VCQKQFLITVNNVLCYHIHLTSQLMWWEASNRY